jgi:hypothetical protein
MAELTRRELLGAALSGAGIWLLGRRGIRAAEPLPAPLLAELEKSPLVYVSPLRTDGRESRCHGEVWFAWEGGSVALVTSRDSWKARALGRGLERARVWVADFGRIHWNAEAKLASAPRFDARARIDPDRASFERLIPIYARKYPDEWASKWEARFRNGMADGSRVLIRYTPV